MRFKAKEQKDEKQIQLLRNIQTIMLILIEHDNVDLLMTLIKEKVFIEVLEILEGTSNSSNGKILIKEMMEMVNSRNSISQDAKEKIYLVLEIISWML